MISFERSYSHRLVRGSSSGSTPFQRRDRVISPAPNPGMHAARRSDPKTNQRRVWRERRARELARSDRTASQTDRDTPNTTQSSVPDPNTGKSFRAGSFCRGVDQPVSWRDDDRAVSALRCRPVRRCVEADVLRYRLLLRPVTASLYSKTFGFYRTTHVAHKQQKHHTSIHTDAPIATTTGRHILSEFESFHLQTQLLQRRT